MDEGIRIARSAAIDLLSKLGASNAPSSIADALAHLGLDQTVVSRSADLPFPKIPASVRGVLDARDAAIYVVDERAARQRWISAHEIGHYAIEEHNRLLMLCNTWDLSPAARQIVEREANEFAAAYLFQGRRFLEECLQLPFSLEMLRSQSQRWEVSHEAAFRYFAEWHPEPVALMVWEPIGLRRQAVQLGASRIVVTQGSCQGVRLRYIAPSLRYRREGAHVEVGQKLGDQHEITRAILAAGDTYCWLTVENHPGEVPASIFFNGYHALVLVGLKSDRHLAAKSAAS